MFLSALHILKVLVGTTTATGAATAAVTTATTTAAVTIARAIGPFLERTNVPKDKYK